MAVRNVELVKSGFPWPEGLPEAMNTTVRELDSPVMVLDPDGQEVSFDSVYEFDTFSISGRKAIAYLANLAEEQGVQFEKRGITRQELEALDGVVINASGIGSGELSGQPIVNYKGHTFVAKPRDEFLLPKEALSVDDLIMMPRADGTVVFGALYIENPERPVPEAEEAKHLIDRLTLLIRRAASFVEGLDPELLNHSDILSHSAGYRVESSTGGMRVAPDEENEKLLHAYGFGGIGWSVGPYFAKKIADMAHEL